MYQRQFQKIQHQTTAHLAQTMTLLSMNNGELDQEIEKALNENPALEKSSERRCPHCKRVLINDQICPVCSKPKSDNSDDSIVFLSPRSDFYHSKSEYSENTFSPEELSSNTESLAEYVLRQIALDLEEQDRGIAAYLLNILDENGFIQEDEISTAQYFHVPVSRIQKIKSIIKKADPVGVGSSSSKEAMLAQIESLRESQEIPPNLFPIIDEELEKLSKKRYEDIAKRLDISVDEIKEAEKFIIKNLNPFPAHAYWGSTRNPTADRPEVFSKPDVIIQNLNNDPDMPLVVEIILPYNGSLEINSLYKKAIKAAELESKEELKTDYDKANLFIKCLQQRNNTIQKLMMIISKHQKEFINKGGKYLIPTTRASIAKVLGVHESTVSRAVSNKSIQLPNGRIIPLSKFFDKSLGIRAELTEIIKAEDPENPLSDTKIRDELKHRGYSVARRTVAKYRSMERILPAYMRKKINA